jgi:alpha-L-rhamnosidase
MPVTPRALRCEGRTAPLGIGERRPRLEWKLASDVRGERPSAYRVQVAERDADLATGEHLLWDTGRVGCGGEVGVEYDGAPLRSATRYVWRVTVWDREGATSLSETSWFETGLLHVDDWRASWIAHDWTVVAFADPPSEGDSPFQARGMEPCPHLRRAFELTAPVVRARLYASARGIYELRLNGRRVGDAELAPGWTDYARRIQYQTYDVTALVRQGANVLGAILADGWWSGYVGFDPRRPAQHYGSIPAVLVQLHVEHPNGSRSVIASDERWRERRGPIRYADLLMGECHDKRLDLGAWDAPGYDDRDWAAVRHAGGDHDLLVAAVGEPVRVTDELRATSIERLGPERQLVDFGQNLVGRVRLTVRDAPRGLHVALRHGEMLDEDGGIYTVNLRSAAAADVLVCSGAATEAFEPRFTLHGFRYVEVAGLAADLRADDVTAQVLHSDTPWVGSFRCSDAEVAQLQRNIVWGQRGNFVSVPTDCPQRDERLGWLADAQVFLPTASYNADVAAFFDKWLRDVRDAQSPEGAFTNVAPRMAGVADEGAPAWGDAGVIVPWHLYRVYGDRGLLARSLDSMLAWVDYVHERNPELVWRRAVGPHFGDWLQVDVQTPREVLATAYFARSAELTARSARVVGREPDAARCATLARRIRETFAREFVDADGRVTGETQTAYLLALAFDLLPAGLAARAAQHLAADVEARGHLTTGFIGVGLLAPVLTDHGRVDLAYALLHRSAYPSWAHSIRHGATTIWERWDGWTEERGFQSPAMNSFNHYALGSIGAWLYRDVAGISQAPDSVAFGDLVFRPRPGGRLTWAEASYDSVRGRIATRWEIAADELHLEVEIPPGARATVHVPTTEPETPVHRIGSGRYSFSARWDRSRG